MWLSVKYQLPGKETFLGETCTKSSFLLCFSGLQCLVVFLSTREGMLGSCITAAADRGSGVGRDTRSVAQTLPNLHAHLLDGTICCRWTSQPGNIRLQSGQTTRFTCRGRISESGRCVGLDLFALKSYGDC